MGNQKSRSPQACVFGARPEGIPVCFPTRPSRFNKHCSSAGNLFCYTRQEMHPVLSTICGKVVSGPEDVKSCLRALAKIEPSSYVGKMEATERKRAKDIRRGNLSLYLANEFSGDLCALLPERECIDEGRGKPVRCAWSQEGGDVSPEPTCGALVDSYAGNRSFDTWTSHLGDDMMTYPFQDAGDASSSDESYAD